MTEICKYLNIKSYILSFNKKYLDDTSDYSNDGTIFINFCSCTDQSGTW